MTASRDRLVPLDGALNFRDLGGYPAAGGRTTRWGRVYRSDGLDQLTDADLDRLSRLGIRLVCDLRNDHEVRDAPSRLPSHPTLRHLRHPIGQHRDDAPPLLERILAGKVREFSAGQMADLYVTMLEIAGPTFAQVVLLAADPANHPMVFHCTAGKDRTGVAAALLLGVLGVADDDLLDDYELTTTYRSATRIESLRPRLTQVGVDVDAVRAYLSAERPVLAATLGYIRTRWGSIEDYLFDAGGLDHATVQQARAELLHQSSAASQSGGRSGPT
jgi:protein-tyrosine phosphatase